MQDEVRVHGLVQERRNSIANSSALAMELRHSCTNPLMYMSILQATTLDVPFKWPVSIIMDGHRHSWQWWFPIAEVSRYKVGLIQPLNWNGNWKLCSEASCTNRDWIYLFCRRHFRMTFLVKKMCEFWFQFHWSSSPRVQLTISQHWSR